MHIGTYVFRIFLRIRVVIYYLFILKSINKFTMSNGEVMFPFPVQTKFLNVK